MVQDNKAPSCHKSVSLNVTLKTQGGMGPAGFLAVIELAHSSTSLSRAICLLTRRRRVNVYYLRVSLFWPLPLHGSRGLPLMDPVLLCPLPFPHPLEGGMNGDVQPSSGARIAR